MTVIEQDRIETADPAPRRGGGDASDGLPPIIARLRRRWRLRLLLRGLFWFLLAASALIGAGAWAIQQWHFAPSLIDALRWLTWLGLVALLLLFCLKPLLRRSSDLQVALYYEENEPRLQAIVSSAIDVADAQANAVSPALRQRLRARALEASSQAGHGLAVDAGGIRQGLARSLGALLLIAAAVAWSPAFFTQALSSLLLPLSDAAEFSPYRLEVRPGNVEIARGADQLVSARIDGFDGDDVKLFTSADDGNSWRESSMTPGQRPGSYDGFLFDLATDLDYYVTGAGQRSQVYRVSVADIPAIAEIALEYHYPDYTGLEPELVTGGGDITALRGTRVEVMVTPTIDIPGGELILGDGRRVDLQKPAAGPLRGTILVDADGAYRVSLQRSGGASVDASPEFRITALSDALPSVAVVSPGRDTKVSMIEEPVMAIRAGDDQGVAELELVLSINGGTEQVVALLEESSAGALREVEAEHMLMLEDLDLRPGDLISYYARATDRAPVAGAQTATSDIFFYQVRPFDSSFRRAEQRAAGGGGGGQQGGQQSGFLSEQQKQFVVATFKMIRDRGQYSEQAYSENLDLLIRAEARIRDRVEAILRRIRNRALVQLDERYQVITEELPKAAEKMREVEQQLGEAEVEAALTDAQIALRHLQRADAVFREMNVALGNRSGGGSGQSSGMEDLANLFQLEMDKLRNQYEAVQRGQQAGSPESLIDETLEKLQELARRQQKELERRMRAGSQVPTEQSRERQLALAAELEEMARQLERLSRQQQNQRLQQSIDRMRGAADAMRRSAGGEGDSMQQARQAAESLREARRLLDEGKASQFSEALERTLRRAQLAERQQAEIRRDVAELEQQWGEKMKSQLNRLDQRKQSLLEQLSNLEQELSELTARSREQQPRANESLKQAVRAAREHRLRDRIGRTREMLLLAEREAANDNESEIQAGIRRMREGIESARANVGESEQRGLERSLEQMHELARELRYLRDRAARAEQQRQQAQRGAGGQGQNQQQAQRGGGQGQQQAQRGASATRGDRPGLSGQGVDGRDDSRESIDGQGGYYPSAEELESLAERARGMRGGLVRQQVAAADVDAVLQKIDQMVTRAGPEQTELQDAALRALMQLEYRLRQRLEQHEYPELFVSDPAELPPEYRDMVADYFRSLNQP